jgi:hypothetical protein
MFEPPTGARAEVIARRSRQLFSRSGRKALSALAGFISNLKVKFQDIELGMDVHRRGGWRTAAIWTTTSKISSRPWVKLRSSEKLQSFCSLTSFSMFPRTSSRR